MIAVGLVPDLTSQAAKMAALSAGAKVLKTYSYELSEPDAAEIESRKPDIILLCGGTDGGNKEVILHNAEVIAAIQGDFPVVAAGNAKVSDKVLKILNAAGKEAFVCENVMPTFNELNIEPAREVIRFVFLKRIVRAKGLTKIEKLISGIAMPTPSAVLNAVSLLSKGTSTEKGFGELMAIDVGGATTDVYSVCSGIPVKTGVVFKGLPEPFAKRTVEGDLGVRYSARPLVDATGTVFVEKLTGLGKEIISDVLDNIDKEPGILPRNNVLKDYCMPKGYYMSKDNIVLKGNEVPKDNNVLYKVDKALASAAVMLSVERHAGRIESVYTPFGEVFSQTGKDLTGIQLVIGTGGPIVTRGDAREILSFLLADGRKPFILKPEKAEFLVDTQYILAAMGLLGGINPDKAVRIMKKELS